MAGDRYFFRSGTGDDAFTVRRDGGNAVIEFYKGSLIVPYDDLATFAGAIRYLRECAEADPFVSAWHKISVGDVCEVGGVKVKVVTWSEDGTLTLERVR